MGFARPNPFINYNYLDKLVEKKAKEEEEARKARNTFPSSQIKCRTCPYVCKECYDILEHERRNQFMYKNSISGHHPSHSLCWCCVHSVDNGCEWAAHNKPVDGWEAVIDVCDATTRLTSYNVKSCPKFKRG